MIFAVFVILFAMQISAYHEHLVISDKEAAKADDGLLPYVYAVEDDKASDGATA